MGRVIGTPSGARMLPGCSISISSRTRSWSPPSRPSGFAKPWERRRENDFAESARPIEVVGESMCGVAPLEAHTVPHGTLRIHVDDERLQPSASERRSKVDGGRRLPHATFLTDDREHMPHGYGSVSSRALGSEPERRSSSVCCACRTQRSDSAPDGGSRRNASRCSIAPSISPFLISRNARP